MVLYSQQGKYMSPGLKCKYDMDSTDHHSQWPTPATVGFFGSRFQWRETSTRDYSKSLSKQNYGYFQITLGSSTSILAGTKKLPYWQGKCPDYHEETAMLSHIKGREQCVCHSGDPVGYSLYSHTLFYYNEQVQQPQLDKSTVTRCSDALEMRVRFALLAIYLDLQKCWPL